MLKVDAIHTYYGDSHILHSVSLSIDAGRAVALLGRNGMGKTTTIRSIVGFTPPRRGSVHFLEQDVTRWPAHRRARFGMSLCPQGRRIFSSLSVTENLTMAARGANRNGDKNPWTLERVYEHFPILRERARLKGTTLSGGEQQMLAIGRALMTNPQLFILDEPSEGLAPIIVRDITEIICGLKEMGLSILLVEQNLPMALQIADDTYIISKGENVYHGHPEELAANREVKDLHLGVAV